MKLKLGSTTYAYLWDYSLSESLELLAGMGLKYIEIASCLPDIWPREFNANERKQEEIRSIFEKYDLKPVSVNASFLDLNLMSENPGIRDETLRQFKEQIDLANILNAPIAVVSAGKRHPLMPPPYKKSWDRAKQGLVELVKYGKEKNIIIGLENGWSGISTADQLEKITEELKEEFQIDSKYLKIVFDVANSYNIAEDPIKGLDKVFHNLGLVHLSDTDGVTWAHAPIGKGKIDFKSVSEKLKDLKYDGVSILEIAYPQDPHNAIKDSIKIAEDLGWR